MSEKATTAEQEKVTLKFFIEYGAGVLWPGNEAAYNKYGLGPLDETLYEPDGNVSREPAIKLREPLAVQRHVLLDLYRAGFDQDDIPAGPSLWTSQQRADFDSQARELYHYICDYLDDDFEVIYSQN
jgi:hypothetical protein